MEYDVFSANPSISPTGLKPSDVANRVEQGERVGLGRKRGRTVGNGVELGGNGVELGGTESDWGERG